jgi:hypothetical protein
MPIARVKQLATLGLLVAAFAGSISLQKKTTANVRKRETTRSQARI